MRLITSELKLLVTIPVPGASHITLLDCANAALALLKHVTEEFAPNGYLSYGQDFIPFSTAYAGAWLFKVSLAFGYSLKDYAESRIAVQQYSRMDDQLRVTTAETFRRLSDTCRAQTQFDRDTTSYYCRFFDHLVSYLTPVVSLLSSLPAKNVGAEAWGEAEWSRDKWGVFGSWRRGHGWGIEWANRIHSRR